MEVILMSDLASHLKKIFDASMFDRLEAYWVLPDGKSFERTDEDESAIEIFKVLLATVDAIPPSLIDVAEELRAAEPQRFEVSLSHGLESVGYGFSPADATEFVEALNRTVQSEMTSA
jgi:hypothetical protein